MSYPTFIIAAQSVHPCAFVVRYLINQNIKEFILFVIEGDVQLNIKNAIRLLSDSSI